ncbi:hypothetical protein ACT4R9_11510 [Ornithobacterium rhinotracheale]|uniref:hypothetical protein n=1 Tax=Ornithobacterium rhinotracheale TaxID=28251 RepID=UPI003FA4C79F
MKKLFLIPLLLLVSNYAFSQNILPKTLIFIEMDFKKEGFEKIDKGDTIFFKTPYPICPCENLVEKIYQVKSKKKIARGISGFSMIDKKTANSVLEYLSTYADHDNFCYNIGKGRFVNRDDLLILVVDEFDQVARDVEWFVKKSTKPKTDYSECYRNQRREVF